MKLLTTGRVVVRITVIIASLEALIMLLLGFMPHAANAYLVAGFDVAALATLSTPLIYFWVIRPFVTARDEALAQVNHLAHVDPLTQIANRRLLWNYLEKDIASSGRHKCYGGLLLLDLDGFKRVNDTQGHGAGDAVLIEVAGRLQSITRTEDVVGRLGGDEFVVLINRLDSDEQTARAKVLQVANKLIALVKEPILYQGKMLQVGASIGIRLLGFEKVDPEVALREADTAMYNAKQTGRARAVFSGD